MDAWDGYKVSRDKLLDFIDTREIANPIVITGDVHQNWADDLLRDFSQPGLEDPRLRVHRHVDLHHRRRQRQRRTPGAFTENPWIKYNSQRRGYCRVALDQQLCRADYRTLPYVKRPGSPITTHRSFVVEAGHPGLKDA